jgi:hypothetical protein
MFARYARNLCCGPLTLARAQEANRDVVVAPSDVGGIVDRVQTLSLFG